MNQYILNMPIYGVTITPAHAVSDEEYKKAERDINTSMEEFDVECKSAHANAMNRARDAMMGPQ